MRTRLRGDWWSTGTLVAVLLLSAPAVAETVKVKDQGAVDLSRLECQGHTHSNFITRVCYDARNRTLLLRFEDETYRQFCRVDVNTANGLLSAPSKGRFYNDRIRGISNPGPHDCLTHKNPTHKKKKSKKS